MLAVHLCPLAQKDELLVHSVCRRSRYHVRRVTALKNMNKMFPSIHLPNIAPQILPRACALVPSKHPSIKAPRSSAENWISHLPVSWISPSQSFVCSSALHSSAQPGQVMLGGSRLIGMKTVSKTVWTSLVREMSVEVSTSSCARPNCSASERVSSARPNLYA